MQKQMWESAVLLNQTLENNNDEEPRFFSHNTGKYLS